MNCLQPKEKTIKVLFAPLNYGDVLQDGVYNAFKDLGCNLHVFDYMHHYLHCKNPKKVRDSFITEAKYFHPDLIHLQIQHTSIIDAESIKIIKNNFPNVIVTNWTGDVRNYVPHTYKKIAQVSDYNFISSTGQLKMFNDAMVGKKVQFWQIGYNPDLYYPIDNFQSNNFKYDAAFIAHFTKKEDYPGTRARLDMCRLMRREFNERFGCFGNGWPKDLRATGSVDQRTVASVYHKSFCPISVSHYNEISHYFSDRLLMCMASGRPTVALKFPNYEAYFTHMSDAFFVDEIQEIPEAVRFLKSKPDLANFIGRSGSKKVLAEHTYYSRVKELLHKIGLLSS